ncbi:AMP-binding protein [Bartonella queenslandensis]|uniref:AMP-binding protein n=1 Tax=Bartonella queenslandensis TaxID=481138 RepID=UPI001BAD2904|nr:AMP-binding protein [Bartonella queenslandensis]
MIRQAKNSRVKTKLAFLNPVLIRILSDSPDSLAVWDGYNQLTYKQMFDSAWQIVKQFKEVGLGAGQRLALDSCRSSELYVMVLACLLSGISFISVPATMSANQKYQFTIRSRCIGICSDLTEFSELQSVKVGVWQLWLIPENESCDISADEVYCVRTSGTTGDPKLVPIHVEQLNAFLQNCHKELAIPTGLTWSWFHDLSFDFSIWELFGTLSHGGCLVVINEKAKRDPTLAWTILKKCQVHLLSVTPSEFRYLFVYRTLQQFNELMLQKIVLCGEKLTTNTILPFFDILDECKVQLINTYGPSEATVFCSAWFISNKDFVYDTVPIGKPFSDMSFSLEDKITEQTGNLKLEGVQVFLGYDGLKPLDSGYLTGDICRCDDNGIWHFMRRSGGYYKINGFRVDPLEIEKFLQSIFGVCEAVVWLEEKAEGPAMLIACVNVMSGITLTTRELRSASIKLSPWLRPSRYIIIPQSEWPMSSRGKTDREEIKRRYYDA